MLIKFSLLPLPFPSFLFRKSSPVSRLKKFYIFTYFKIKCLFISVFNSSSGIPFCIGWRRPSHFIAFPHHPHPFLMPPSPHTSGVVSRSSILLH